MNTGAHPDDERSALLAWLSLGQGVRTISVIANRGEGGQNEIGDELGNALGIIRSRELQKAADYLGIHLSLLSETIDDPIYDFGFSKSPEETLSKWGRETTYERLIRQIRMHRPDIVMPSFRDVPSEHGHHRAISQLTLQAFKDAADPNVFPEHRKQGLEPWQVKKVYLPATPETETLRFNIGGKVDPVYGLTYPQLGEESRKFHKSQGMGRDLPVEDYFVSLQLVESAVGEVGKESSLFDGLPHDFADLAAQVADPAVKSQLLRVHDRLHAVLAAYPDRHEVSVRATQALREVRRAAAVVRCADLEEALKKDLLFRLQVKEDQLQRASLVASRLDFTLETDRPVLVQGDRASFTLRMKNGGHAAITGLHLKPRVPEGWKVHVGQVPKHLPPGQERVVTFTVDVPSNAGYFHPYRPPAVQVDVAYRIYGETVEQTIAPEQTVAVLPDWGLRLRPEATILNTETPGEAMTITVEVTNYRPGPSEGSVKPALPEGWQAEPAVHHLSFSRQGESKEVTFRITPPGQIEAGEYRIPFAAHVGNRSFDTQVQPISYEHIGTSYLLTDAELRIRAFPLKRVSQLKVGYVESGFDQVASHLREAGIDVVSLDEEDLATGDLQQYDTIVVGIRAYLSRDDLLRHNDRLLEYVRNGGHVVMQYHKPEDRWDPALAPYPIQPGSPSILWRVTDENGPVTFLQPDHALFQCPNTITEQDFDGWVQERGLYFPSSWDGAYTPLLSMADPGEEPLNGGLLVADYGAGSYIYTSLVWYRQIQNQVPGAYRMFVNLISYPKCR